MICKFCLEGESKLIKAHAIPKALFAFGGGGEQRSQSKILTSAEERFPRRSPQGIYDQELLCDQCEKKFQNWDDEGIRFFQEDHKNRYPVKAEFKVYDVPVYKYQNLKLFFLSVLWRAHHFKDDFYRKVHLGDKHEAEIKRMMECADPGDEYKYPIILKRFNTDRPGAMALLGPFSSKVFERANLNYYELFFPSFVAMIKVDKRNWPKDVVPLIMRPKTPLIVPLMQFEGSAYHQAMLKTVNTHPDAM